jgi:hypothetical protein
MSRASRFAAAAVMAGAVAVAGLTVGAGTSTAEGPSYNGGNCPGGMTCTHWCPGDPAIPGSQVLSWEPNICHDWYWNSEGIVDVSTSTIYPWSGVPHQVAPSPAPMGPAAAPLSPPPGMPFCSPRGALFIIPPICDEIGYDWPPGSLKR